MADIFQTIDELDAKMRDVVISRLEDRAQMPQFAAIRDKYLDLVGLPDDARIHELGCGTGAVARAIAGRAGFSGHVDGSDLSRVLIDAARRLAEQQGVANVTFSVSDGQANSAETGDYDVVLGHTVISHVTEPKALVAEMVRLTKPGGMIVIHDADYASLTYHSGAAELDRDMPPLYMNAIIANRFVMRELPGLLIELGLKPELTIGDIVVETDPAEYFPGIPEHYADAAVERGGATRQQAEDWVASVKRAVADGRFYGSCNYVTYAIRKPA